MDIFKDLLTGLCSYSLCSPGYIQKKGVYCATDSCNVFGCNCDGECINDNYVDRHLQRLRQESDNINLTYANLSRARRSTKTRNININGNLDSHTPTSHSQANNPLGSSIGYDHDKRKHLFDYNDKSLINIFNQLNSTQQDAFLYKAQIINLNSSNNSNATEAFQKLHNSINDA
ncbi:hypothetical protein QTP88_013305 [Uroleucon formosanum]